MSINLGGIGNGRPVSWIDNIAGGANLAATVLDRRHVQIKLKEPIDFTEVDLNTTGSIQEAGFSVYTDTGYKNIVAVKGTGTDTIDIYLYSNIGLAVDVFVEYRAGAGDAVPKGAVPFLAEQIADSSFDGDLVSGDWFSLIGGSITGGQLVMAISEVVRQDMTSLNTGSLYRLSVDVASCSADFTVFSSNPVTIDVATFGSGGVFEYDFIMDDAEKQMQVSTIGGGAAVLNGYSLKEFGDTRVMPSLNRIEGTNVIEQAIATEAVALPSEFSSSQLKMLIDGSLLNGANKLYDSSPSGTAVLPFVGGLANQNGVRVITNIDGKFRSRIHPTSGFWDYPTDTLKSSGADNPDNLDSGAWKSLLDSSDNALLFMNVGRYVDPDGGTEAYDGKCTLRTQFGTGETIGMSNNATKHGNMQNAGETGVNTAGQAVPAIGAGVDVCQFMKYHLADGEPESSVLAEYHVQRVSGTEMSAVSVDTNGGLGTDLVPTAGILYEGFTMYAVFVFEFQGGFPETIDDDISWVTRKMQQGDIVFPSHWLQL